MDGPQYNDDDGLEMGWSSSAWGRDVRLNAHAGMENDRLACAYSLRQTCDKQCKLRSSSAVLSTKNVQKRAFLASIIARASVYKMGKMIALLAVPSARAVFHK